MNNVAKISLTKGELLKTRAIWLCVGGAVVFLALVVYGWKSPGGVDERVAAGKEAGRTEVLAEVCADRFMANAEAVKAMADVGYGRDSVVRKYVKDGKNDLDYGLANACARVVVDRMDAAKKKG